MYPQYSCPSEVGAGIAVMLADVVDTTSSVLVPTVETAVGDEGKDTVEDEGGDAAGEVGEDV